MNTFELKRQLEIDEGRTYRVYVDTTGNFTVGVGHKIIKGDILLNDASCTALLNEDIAEALLACERLIDDFYTHSEEVQQVLANMAFNLGQTRLGKFKRMLSAINSRNYYRAALQMERSLWYKQVGNRAKRLVARMKAAANA